MTGPDKAMRNLRKEEDSDRRRQQSVIASLCEGRSAARECQRWLEADGYVVVHSHERLKVGQSVLTNLKTPYGILEELRLAVVGDSNADEYIHTAKRHTGIAPDVDLDACGYFYRMVAE